MEKKANKDILKNIGTVFEKSKGCKLESMWYGKSEKIIKEIFTEYNNFPKNVNTRRYFCLTKLTQ